MKHVFGATLESETYVGDMKISQVQQSKGSKLFLILCLGRKACRSGTEAERAAD